MTMHLRQQRYQNGTVKRKQRRRGPDVWEFRYYENDNDGRRRRAMIIGNVVRYPAKRDALRALEPLLHRINIESRAGGPATVNMLIERFKREELVAKNYSTRQSYLSCSKRLEQR